MSYGWWSLVIFLTALVTFGLGIWVGAWAASPQAPQQPDPAPPRGELPRAGYFDLPDALTAVYGPFPADTGPLLILSEQAAANDALEREVRWLGDEAERKIGPVR